MHAIRSDEEWFATIQECRASGLPDRVWCRENGISSSSFYYNVKKLRNKALDIPVSKGSCVTPIIQEVVPLHIKDEPENLPAGRNKAIVTDINHESVNEPLDTSSSISIESNGITVTCKGAVSSSILCSIIKMLQTRC
ncbi:MAG: IS66 family insertion sequence element accessory protein TnpB [Oribacterium sp.]|nr:IS66 family insertion sequence element accessory protein TnpB [Oribacterium sp.]